MAHANLLMAFGKDAFLVEEQASDWIHEILPSHEKGDFGLEVVDGSTELVDAAIEALSKTLQALRQTSFFATDKVVWLRNVAFAAARGRLATSPAVKDAVESFRRELAASGLPPGVTLLVTGITIAKTSAFFKAIQSFERDEKAEIIEFQGGASAAQKIVGRILKANGWTMSPETLEALLARVGTDGRILQSECEKLYAYTAGAEPTPDDVDAVCSLNLAGEPWKLQDDFASRNLEKTLAELRKQFSMKVSEIFLLQTLIGRAADLALLADSRERGLLDSSGSTWASSLSEAHRDAVAALGKADVFARPPFQRGRTVAYARLWSRGQALHACKILLDTYAKATSLGVDQKVLLEAAIAEALA